MEITPPVRLPLKVRIPMRDGINLSANIYLPKAKGPFSTLLIRTPYDSNSPDMIEKGRSMLDHGYACVIQDVRGRWGSDGDFYPFHVEIEDGFDTQEWIGSQNWSTGKIGMAGASYLGLVQWLSAPLRSRYLTAIAPRVICGDFYSGLVHPGGAVMLNVAMTWGMYTNGRTRQDVDYHQLSEKFHALPLIEMDQREGTNLDFWKDWMTHTTYDEYWEKINVQDKWGEITVPALNIGGWYDLYAPQTFTNFNGLRQNGRTPESRKSKIVVGPWVHSLNTSQRTGDIDFGADSMMDLDALELRWYDYWLRGIDNGITTEPPISLYIMGINQWREENEWPLARTEWQKWYLHSDGDANTATGSGHINTQEPLSEPPDRFTYDPMLPVPTVGGANCCSPQIIPWGPQDQRPVERRDDVLCYTSAVLAKDLELTGPINIILYASTDGFDTDWTVKLIDVLPTGYAMLLCDGIIRARFRDSLSYPELLKPDQIYEYEIEVGVTGNVFRKDHSIRIDISSSNFPRFDRNLNTGHELHTDSQIRTATQTVHHSQQYPSHAILPLIPI